jgi:hypothetical protein
MARKYKVEINNVENLKELLNITYDLADAQIVQAQNEMNKLANSTRLQEEPMQSKKDYAKAMNDYMAIKDKAISKKLDIAKLMSELIKYNGNQNEVDENMSLGSINFDKIREIIDKEDNQSEIVKLKK